MKTDTPLIKKLLDHKITIQLKHFNTTTDLRFIIQRIIITILRHNIISKQKYYPNADSTPRYDARPQYTRLSLE